MTRFEPRKDLDLQVARQIGLPLLGRVLDMLEDEARRRAPDGKVWVTMRDEKVRPEHRDTDAQVVPANLRFQMPKADGTTILARRPRDPNLPIELRINCRCDDPALPDALRSTIHSTGATLEGTRVHGSVETWFPRAAESEFGTSEDQAAHFMTGALNEVALRLSQGQAR